MADAPKLNETDTLKDAYPKINSAIDNANAAKQVQDGVQAQIDALVVSGDSSPEAAQARVASDGTTFTTLQERLNDSDAQLAETKTDLKQRAINMGSYRHLVVNGDWTNAIQTAIDEAADGATIFFPKNEGDYKISRSSNVINGINVIERNNITLTSDGALVFIENIDVTNDRFVMLSFKGCKNIRIEGFKFKLIAIGSPTVRKNTEILQFTTNPELTSVAQSTLVKTENITVEKNDFEVRHDTLVDGNLVALYGIHAHTPESGTLRLVKGVRVLNNTFKDSDGRLVQTYLCDDVTVEGNSFYNVGSIHHVIAVRMIGAGRKIRVRNNYIEIGSGNPAYTNDAEGIRIGGFPEMGVPIEDAIVEGNVIKCCYRYNAKNVMAIYLAFVDGAIVKGNTVRQTADGGDSERGDAIRIMKYDGYSNKNILITGNSIKSIRLWHVYTDDNLLENVVLSNNFFGITIDKSSRTVYDTNNRILSDNNYIEYHTNVADSGRKAHLVSGVLVTEIQASSIPTTNGLTLEKGSFIHNTNSTKGKNKGWVCTIKGTQGTLSGVTGSITAGTNQLTLNIVPSTLKAGQYISVVGLTSPSQYQISAINGNIITLVQNAPTTVTDAAVNYYNAAFEMYGQTGTMTSITNTPDFIGQIAVVSGIGYMATGTLSSADWKQITV